MSLGLKRGTVHLESHEKQWEEVAVQTIRKLKAILGEDAIGVYVMDIDPLDKVRNGNITKRMEEYIDCKPCL